MNIAIAGAGLMGRLLAWSLAERGEQVRLFDADPDGSKSAAYVAAAMLAPYSEATHAPRAVIEDGVAGLALWPQLLRQLVKRSGKDVFWQQKGSLAVAHRLDAGDLQQFARQLEQHAAVPKDKVIRLNANALQAIEPALGENFQSGLLIEDEACLDNNGLLDALGAALRVLNVDIAQGQVDAVGAGQLACDGTRHQFDWVIDCRGIGAREQLPGLRGVRGEVMRVYAPEVKLQRPVRLMHPRHALYIVPRPGPDGEENHYVVGATEIESDSTRKMTVRSSMELLSALFCVHSGFAEAEISSQLTALRPAFPDNLPRVEHSPGLSSVNGLYRHGFLLAPQMLAKTLVGLPLDDSHQLLAQG